MFFLKRTISPPDLVKDPKKEIESTQVTAMMETMIITIVQTEREVLSLRVIPANRLENARKFLYSPPFSLKDSRAY